MPTRIPALRGRTRCVAVHAFGELVRKMWSPGLFKGHVSPHELLQAVSTASKKRFTTSVQSDARDFLTWFLNELHFDLGGTKAPGSSAIVRAFQGMVEVKTSKLRIINQDTAQQQHVLSDGSGGTHGARRRATVGSPGSGAPLRAAAGTRRGADEGGDAVPVPGAEPAAAAAVQGRARPQHHPAGAARDAAQPVRRPERPGRHAQGGAALVPDQEAAAVPDPDHAALLQEQLDAREEPDHHQLSHQERRPGRVYAAREPRAPGAWRRC